MAPCPALPSGGAPVTRKSPSLARRARRSPLLLLLLLLLGLPHVLASREECERLRTQYGVKVGHSWGSMPPKEQQRWESLGADVDLPSL